MNPQADSCPAHERDAADHDQPYTWGRPTSTYLAPREVARLMILRCRLQERQALRNRHHSPTKRARPVR